MKGKLLQISISLWPFFFSYFFWGFCVLFFWVLSFFDFFLGNSFFLATCRSGPIQWKKNQDYQSKSNGWILYVLEIWSIWTAQLTSFVTWSFHPALPHLCSSFCHLSFVFGEYFFWDFVKALQEILRVCLVFSLTKKRSYCWINLSGLWLSFFSFSFKAFWCWSFFEIWFWDSSSSSSSSFFSSSRGSTETANLLLYFVLKF
jgi:hypothetical protein